MEDVQRQIPYFIEDAFFQERLHSALGYSPLTGLETMHNSTPYCCQSTLILAL
jgi:hypothetical protein